MSYSTLGDELLIRQDNTSLKLTNTIVFLIGERSRLSDIRVLIQSKLVTRFPGILAQQVRFERNPVYSVKQKETQLHVKSLLALGNKMLDLIYL